MSQDKKKLYRGLGLLALRVTIGSVLIYHGYSKLTGIPMTTGFFASLGIPMAGVMAYVVGLVELVGGLFILAGFLTCYTTAVVAVNMLVALLTAHLGSPWKGAELALVVLGGTLALMGTGAGKWSVDKMWCHKGCGSGKCGGSCGTEMKETKEGCCGGSCGSCGDEHGEEKKA